ncbi:MAG: hypothetical protein ACK5LJ_08165 [Paracoccus sp. (in: a-proteobacteria)]
MAYTSAQQQALALYEEAKAEIPKLEPFFHGRIPNMEHYKRLNLDREKAIQIASYGHLVAKRDLGVKLYFTQSLFFGAAILGTHHDIAGVLPSQYGKSFVSACIAIWLGANKQEVSVAGNDTGVTEKIMSEVRKTLPLTSKPIKDKLTTPVDQFEKMQTSLSRMSIGFIGGGAVTGITLGGKRNDSLSGNKAVGQSGNYIIDESALVPDANYAETGRSEVGYREDGKPYMSMEISNPHQINHFYRKMNNEEIGKGQLVIWADLRIAIEEGKTRYYDQDENMPVFTQTKFFELDSTCISYLLCDFGGNEAGKFFGTQGRIDNSPVDVSDMKDSYVLGLDSASRGADSIMGALLRIPNGDEETPRLRVPDAINFKPAEWVDFETPRLIENLIVELCRKVNIVAICMDLGSGEWLYDRLGTRFANESMEIELKGVYFNYSPTKARIAENFVPEDYVGNGAELGVNKRAEMHLDMRTLVDDDKISFSQKVIDMIQPEMNAIGVEVYTSRGKVQIEDKKNVKRRLGHSPDTLDSVLLGVHGFILWELGLLGGDNLSFY